MESFILSPLLSTTLSIFLILGCYELGKNLSAAFKLSAILSDISIKEFQFLTFGLIFLLIILFPVTAFTNQTIFIFKIAGIVIFFFGVKFIFNFGGLLKQFIFVFKKKNFYLYIFILILFLYFLLSLSPLTSADVLDYHSGVALNILRFNSYILLPEWFTGLQSGIGEVLISFGFQMGSEQFGSLVQFSSILSISGIILKNFDKKNLFSSKFFIASIVLSCPILIFLLSGNKPQAFFSSLIFLALSLSFLKVKSLDQFIKIFFLINILLCLSVMGKFSFSLSAFLVWLVSVFNFINIRNYKFIFFIPLVVFLILFLPFLYWKYQNLGGSIISYIFSPFPLHMPGYENFLNHNKGSQEIPFPNFLFYTTASRFTEFLGLNTLCFVLLILNSFKSKKIFLISSVATIFIVISNLYASPSARYYLDPILWSVLGLSFLKNLKFRKYIEYLFYPQIFLIILILLYSNYLFLPGAFFKEKYYEIKHNNAYMYSGIDWVNKNIPKNSRVIIINRPIANYKDFAISGGFNYFTTFEQSIFYKKLIKQKYKIDYLVYLGNTPELMHFKNCVGSLYKQKKNVGIHATRNPFNKGGFYNAYIYNFDMKKLPDC